jgi:hypothetical protein
MVGFLGIIRQLVKDKEFRNLTLFVIFILVIGTIFYHEIEDWGWIDSIYFCVTTLTTVGYGDFSPKTDIAKIFTIIYVLIGIGILFGYIKVLAGTVIKDRSGFIDLITEKTKDLGKKFDMKKTKKLNENSTEKHEKDKPSKPKLKKQKRIRANNI